MSYQNVLVRDALEGESVRRFMKEEPVTVAADTTVDHLVEDFIYKYHYKMFPVVKDSKPLSCVNINDVRNIPGRNGIITQLMNWLNHAPLTILSQSMKML